MPVSSDLTNALKKVVLRLEDDLRERVASQPDVNAAWRGLHAQAVNRERTAMSWQAWRDDRVTQAAVAWVLTSVFIRFCEDNQLLKPVWIAGPGARRQEALDAQLQYFRKNPEHTDREWFVQAVEYLGGLRSTRELVGSHSPLWTVSPSGQAVRQLLTFWRETRDDGTLVWDFTDEQLSTRFLGDLYQDLSDYAKKTFALLQTPEFVEEFILDQTMEAALTERPLEGFRMIDPTCGSGHFLLGAFARLNDRWAAHAPGLEPRARVQKALDAVHGVDLNPFAVAIARFRLMVAALQSCGETSLENAPGFTFHLAAGDSLLHGGHQLEMRFQGFDAASELTDFAYDTEDLDQLLEILTPGRYDVVVGNPPYIEVSDPSLRSAYKTRYLTCVKQWTLVAPFMERFFELAHPSGAWPAGWVGQITANNFMRRDFGKKLVEAYLARIDLRLLADTSGMEIPGHGTPTVILVGRNSTTGGMVRVCRRVGRESRATKAPGPAWKAMTENLGMPHFSDDYVAVSVENQTKFHVHPWNLAGGGESDLKVLLESRTNRKVSDYASRIGFYGDTHADDAFIHPPHFLRRMSLREELRPPIVPGAAIRDWAMREDRHVLRPYVQGKLVSYESLPIAAKRALWPLRTTLWSRAAFSGGTYRSAGLSWLQWHQFPLDANCIPRKLAFSFKAPQLHVVSDNQDRAFNSTSPVVRFARGTSEEVTLNVQALLASSTASFWARQVAQHQGGGATGDPAAWTFEFSAAIVGKIPMPQSVPGRLARRLELAQEGRQEVIARLLRLADDCSPNVYNALESEWLSAGAELVSFQEELDWALYSAFGLVESSLTYGEDPPGLKVGERAFEIALAREFAASAEQMEWFTRHGSTPTIDIPLHWPEGYRSLVQQRLDAIASNKLIRLLEKPEYKRRWATEPWEKQVEKALRGWLLDRLEDRRFWFDSAGRPRVRSVGQLADDVSRDADLSSVLELWSGRKDQSVTAALTSLLDTESVPFLAAHRLKDSGLRKREAWEHTWDLQRREDGDENVSDIPVPPKYTSADFRKTAWWQHRGKLDVPKERFVFYPGAGRDTDPTAVLGWAGWDHAQQALALASLIQEREVDGWEDERLVPLVAGLAELQPWVRQWHDETDPTFQLNLADYLDEQLRNRASQVGRTLDELKAWRPPAATRERRARS
ncbi:BREX-2 system adenine-specific DNA-methyltransferase PglX [Phycicoccus flavus]|uniref:BREX-2 system adenine-specific DNA-methyltransferase PglX n=1 Tax=Phycicoccus flavus TaxID=2502783 RepID=UPI000FEBC962|nr:BREX-2 system adenine-specific DNA-methyltransferase PglX [Phycicoccus flavus]NHA66850.1 BREX-2 system adenine-specific DNA-methyltransferase PglX [Phycicoccus flavus]